MDENFMDSQATMKICMHMVVALTTRMHSTVYISETEYPMSKQFALRYSALNGHFLKLYLNIVEWLSMI